MVPLVIKHFASGVTMVLLGIFFTVWTPTEIVLYDRLFMRPGFLPFVWWQEPPNSANVIEVQIYFFNVTNAEAFLNGSDSKLNFQEFGPFVFGDRLEHFWTTHNENNTLTYATKHNLVYDADKSSIDLDAKLTIPNLSLMALASMASEMNTFYKVMFHAIYRSIRPKPFIETTPRSLLWNFSDPLLDKFKMFLPLVSPIKGEIGVLQMVNPLDIRNITVLLGAENGHERFFTIDNYDGSKYLPKLGPACKETLVNVSDSQFPQYLKRTSHLKWFKDNYCRCLDLFYEKDVSKFGMNAYKFQAAKTCFYRKQPLEDDCFKGSPSLPNGVADLSHCAYGLPVVMSFPHFLHADFTQERISGYRPNATRFLTYSIVEPLTGAPLESELSCQVNIQVKNLTGIDDSLKIFRNLFLPAAWVKVHVDLPWYITAMLFLTVRLAPIVNIVLCAILIVVGCVLVGMYVKNSLKNNISESDVLSEADKKKVTEKLIST